MIYQDSNVEFNYGKNLIHIYIYVIYYIIKVGPKSHGCDKWFHQIAKIFLDLKKIDIIFFLSSSPIISNLIKILI